MQDKLSAFRSKTISMQELDLLVPWERSERTSSSKVFFMFGIVVIFHVDVKVTRQYDWHIPTTSPCQKLKHVAHFWRIPNQVRKYQRFPVVAGSIWRYTNTFYLFTRHSATQTSPHYSEAANLKDVFAMFCLSSFMRRWGVAIVVALFFYIWLLLQFWRPDV
jgi:hypothetical protein